MMDNHVNDDGKEDHLNVAVAPNGIDSHSTSNNNNNNSDLIRSDSSIFMNDTDFDVGDDDAEIALLNHENRGTSANIKTTSNLTKIINKRRSQQQQQQQQQQPAAVNTNKSNSNKVYNDDDDEKKKKDMLLKPKKLTKGQLKWLLLLAKAELPILILGTIALLIGSGITLIVPQKIGQLIDSVLKAGKSYLNMLVLSLVGLFLLQGLVTFARAYLYTIAGERVVARLRKKLFNSIIVQEIAFFDQTRTGELTNRLASDTKALENAVTVNVNMVLRNLLQLIGGVVILFVVSWKLCLVMLSVVPVLSVGAVLYGKFVKNLSKRVQDALASASEVAEESVGNVRTVRSFSQEQRHTDMYARKIDDSFAIAKKLAVAYGAFSGVMMTLANISLILVIWYGGTLVLDGQMSIGTLTSFLLYTLTVAFALASLSSLYFDFMRAIGATERVYEIISRKPAINLNGGKILIDLQGRVEFRDVYFNYPSRPEHPVLNGISLTMCPGKVLALVGESGGGKSTMASLLLRFYDPLKGSILVDDNELSTLDPEWLRGHIAVVSQEPVLFATSIRENISYGKADATDEEIVEAAKAANAHNFISEFPEGYDTMVGERGVRLSGGQKQRIAIARAVLKNPKILLLDEATSALDAESEFLVQEALRRLMQGRTSLVIAHRLSTVKNADVVAVISKGKVVEMGTHQELLAKGGLYKKLVERQLLAPSDDEEDNEEQKPMVTLHAAGGANNDVIN